MGRHIKLGICIPTRGQWEADFGQSLAMAVLAFATTLPEGLQASIKLFNHHGSILPTQRTEMVREALASECTHVLFLDDDMGFPMETIIRLLAHDLPVVAANCATKCLPPLPTARYADGSSCYTRQGSQGLEPVAVVGTGILLAKADVFRAIAEPWFTIGWNAETGRYTGEDWFFCQRLAEHGIPIYVDHDVSREVRHCGRLDYVHPMIPAYYETANTAGEAHADH
ncbi:hypothetical protein GC177_05335 [bacterium]|nr:hypothetical protein [bacterium]